MRRCRQFLDAHERAFEHFGGHTREHLYDRPRTVCQGTEQGRIIWNTTFRAFADYWGFEPRLCRPYRAQTKGKVESGVKYFKRNFLPGREFVDDVHLHEQLAEWNATIADVRVHGTTHERPIDRFAQEQRGAAARPRSQPSFRLEAPLAAHRRRRLSGQRRHQPLLGALHADRPDRRGPPPRRPAARSSTAARSWPSIPSSAASIRCASCPSTGPARSPAPPASGTRPRRRAARSALAPVVEIRDLAVYDALLGDTDIAAPHLTAAPDAAAALDPLRAEVPA